MTKYLFILITFCSIGASAQSFTRIKNPVECKQKINSQAQSTKSISADFKEQIYSSMFNTPKAGEGKLKYKKANMIRWEHSSPKQQVVLINGSKVKLQEDGKEIKSVNTNQVIKKVQGLMIQLFNGDFLNEKEFNITYYQSDERYKLVLKPKSSRMSKYINHIVMEFGKEDLTLKRMVMRESDTESVVYTFSSVVINGQISDSKFNSF